MKLFGFNISRSPKSDQAQFSDQQSRSFDPAAWLTGKDFDPGPSLHNAYEQVVWVYRASNVLAEQIANIPFLFSSGERGRENLIASGPLLDFYARPHPRINSFQYWELRILWLMLRGECIRIPIFEDPSHNTYLASGAPAELPMDSLYALRREGQRESAPYVPPSSSFSNPSSSRITHHASRKLQRIIMLDPASFRHIIENHNLVGWRYTGSRNAPLESQVFLPEEVWFDRLPNPLDFWRGFSPLSPATLAAQTDFAASSFMRGILENNAETGLIVRSEQQLAPEQREQISAALRQRKRRAGAADQSVLLWGATEIVKPQLSSANLQFLENRKFSRAEICAAFGVPEEIITSTHHAKYDVMQGARLNFIENRVAPLCARLEAEEQQVVQAIDPNAVGWFDIDSLPIMQEARRNRRTTAKTGFDMGIPFNELNRVLDLGFKPLPWGDLGFVPSNLQRLGQSPPDQAPNPVTASNQNDVNNHNRKNS